MSEAKRQAQGAESDTSRARSQLATLKREASDAELARDRAKHAQQLSAEVRLLPYKYFHINLMPCNRMKPPQPILMS